MKIEIPRQIRLEDFPEEQRPVIDKLSKLLTPFMTSVYRVLDGGVDYFNLNRQTAVLSILTDDTGALSNPPQIKSTLRTRVAGVVVLSMENLNNPRAFPTVAPFISFSTREDVVTILNITGLAPRTNYSILVELVGI